MKLSFLFPFLFIAHNSLAQNFQYSVELKSVTFSGDSMYQMRKDNGTGPISNAVHWTSDSLIVPSAFVSGTFLKAQAQFEFICANSPGYVYIRGTGPDSISFPALQVTVDSGFIEYPATQATQVFESHVVRYFENFSIEWEISFDNLSWYHAGVSGSPVYVTWQQAIEEGPNSWDSYKYFLTLMHLACKNADGATTLQQAIDMIWEDFTDHSVLNFNGQPLHYYKDIMCMYADIPTLLKHKDGSCFSWAQLFLGTLKIHGFMQPNNYLSLYPGFYSTSCGVIEGFLAKTWTFITPGGACTDLPYVNVWDSPTETDTSYLFQYEDAHDELGVTGQTALNPASWFFSHQVAVVNNKFYDPSYGAVYETLEDLKFGALSGWWKFGDGTEVDIGVDVNNDGDLDTAPWYIYNMMSPDLTMTGLDSFYVTW